MDIIELIFPFNSAKVGLACLESRPEINQFAIVELRIGHDSNFFPKPFFKTLKFQRRTKNLGKQILENHNFPTPPV